LRCLVEEINRIDQESKQHPKERANSRYIQVVFSHASIDVDEASQPQQDDSALDLKWFSSHMGEDWYSNWYSLVFTKLIIGLHGAIGEMYWNLCDYPLLQHSKVKLFDICIHILLRTYFSAYSHDKW
jgi:hypothetical protein